MTLLQRIEHFFQREESAVLTELHLGVEELRVKVERLEALTAGLAARAPAPQPVAPAAPTTGATA